MITLRDYQIDIVQQIAESFSAGHKRIVIQSPTGSGKTVMFSYVAKGAVKKGNKVLILSDRIELLSETGGTLNEFGMNASVVDANNKTIPVSSSISVGMAQTLKRRISDPSWAKWLKDIDIVVY